MNCAFAVPMGNTHNAALLKGVNAIDWERSKGNSLFSPIAGDFTNEGGLLFYRHAVPCFLCEDDNVNIDAQHRAR